MQTSIKSFTSSSTAIHTPLHGEICSIHYTQKPTKQKKTAKGEVEK